MNRLPIRHNDDQRPVNLPEFALFEIDGVDVAEWHRLPNGEGKPEQVHVYLHFKDPKMPTFVLRLKSTRAVDELITALITHRNGVWPKKQSPV